VAPWGIGLRTSTKNSRNSIDEKLAQASFFILGREAREFTTIDPAFIFVAPLVGAAIVMFRFPWWLAGIAILGVIVLAFCESELLLLALR
jgi:hypothetical protein